MAEHTSIGIDLAGTSDMAPTTVHHLPCKIKLDGHAAVSTYFRPDAESTPSTVQFRGRLLKGKRTQLPAGTEGFVFCEKRTTVAAAAAAAADSDEEGDDRHWVADGRFAELTYWTHDKVMSSNDHIPQAMQCLGQAEALHAPIPVE